MVKKQAKKTSQGKIAAAIIITVSLLFSIFFSFSSFTGYVTAEEVNTASNALSVIFFLAGVGGAFFLLRKK